MFLKGNIHVNTIENKVKKKVKVQFLQLMLQRHRERVTGTAALIFKLSNRWGWANNVDLKTSEANIQYSVTSPEQCNSAML